MKIRRSKILFFFVIILAIITAYYSCENMKGMPQCIILEPNHTDSKQLLQKDSVLLIATQRFDAGFIKPIFQGKNYRKAWATPIKVPVIDLNEIRGGLEPLEMGGGMQTLSMDLQGKNQIVYTLRSVNKNPEEVVPDIAFKLNVENIIMDAMSAQHPYGALVVARLADAVDILHTHPKLVYVPHQEELDTFNQKYGGHLFLLEYEPEGSGEWVKLDSVKRIVDTEDVQELLQKYPNSKIDERALVRARLLDLMIGDWDRHAKQWGWIVTKQDTNFTYVPLPTDRDNAFYNPGGLIPWIITRPFSQPILRPFRKKIDYMPGMVKPFDQYFLLDVPESLFIEEAKKLQKDLTDEDIEYALRAWPDEFYDLDAAQIRTCIQQRRTDLVEYAKAFKKVVVERGPLTVPLKGSSKVY